MLCQEREMRSSARRIRRRILSGKGGGPETKIYCTRNEWDDFGSPTAGYEKESAVSVSKENFPGVKPMLTLAK